MNSIQITIEANEEKQEILISELTDLQVQGFEQTENYLIAYFNENSFSSYEVIDVLKNYSFTSQVIEQKNWNEEWEKNFEPVIIDDFCSDKSTVSSPGKNCST